MLRTEWRKKDEVLRLFSPMLPTLPTNPILPARCQKATPSWEWQKNKALLDLVHQNEDLTRLLSLAKKEALEWEVQARCKEEQLQEAAEAHQKLLLFQQKLRWAQSTLRERACTLLHRKHSALALSLWRRYCALCKKKKVLGRAEHMWNTKILVKWFGILQDALIVLRTKRSLLERYLLNQRKRISLQILNCWQSWIRGKKATWIAYTQVVPLRARGLLRKLMTHWSMVCHNSLQCKVQERKATMVLLRKRLQKAWNQLWALKQASSNCKDAAEQLYARRRVYCFFSRWKNYTTMKIMKSTWLLCGAQQRETTLISLSFNGWLGMVRKKFMTTERRAAFSHRALYRCKKVLFNIWFHMAMRNKEKRNFRLFLESKRERHVKEKVLAWLAAERLKRCLIKKFILCQSSKTRLRAFNGWLWQVFDQRWCRLWAWSKRKHKDIQITKGAFFAWLLHHEISRAHAAWGNMQCLEQRLNQARLESKEYRRLKSEFENLYSSLEIQNQHALENFQSLSDNFPSLLEATLQWTVVPNEKGPALLPRAGHSTVCITFTLDSKISTYMVVFGGYNGEKSFGDILLFDTATKNWRIPSVSTETGSAFPRPSWNHTACVYKNKMMVFGGFDGCLQSSELSILSFSNDGESCNWSQPRYSMGASPAPLSQHTCCLYGEGRFMVVFGGYNACKGHLNELWILDLHMMSWTSPECFGTPPSSRRGHGAAVIRNKMFIFGGFDGTSHLCDVQVLDLEIFTWDCLFTKGSGPTPRRHHAVEAVGDHLVVYGGYDGVRYLEDVFSLDTITNIWRMWNPLKIHISPVNNIGGIGTKFARSLHTMTHNRNQLVVIGGVHENESLQDVIILESAAAVQGTQMKSLLLEEMAKGVQLQKHVQGCEELLEKRSRELITQVGRAAQLEHALREEQKQRTVLINKNKLLKRKLEKARIFLASHAC